MTFGLAIFAEGMGMGLFMSPNTASVMNSVPPEHRGAAAGMRSTLQNAGSTIGMCMLFTVVLVTLSNVLPQSIASALVAANAAQLVPIFDKISPTGALFAAFLGYNPMRTVLNQLPQDLITSLDNRTVDLLTGTTWFPNAIAPAFMTALNIAFYFNAGLAIVAAMVSLLRGKKYVYGLTGEISSVRTPVLKTVHTGSIRQDQ